MLPLPSNVVRPNPGGACAAVLCLLAFARPIQADIVVPLVNGGFEQPPTGFFTTINAGSNALTGWTVSGSVNVQASFFGIAFEGNQYLDLDGDSPGAIKQTFATTVGASYILSFVYCNNPLGGTVPASANVSLSGAGVKDLLNQSISHGDSTQVDLNWTRATYSFTANSTTTSLTFSSLDPISSIGGIGIDAVIVTAVPEPSTFLLVGLGVAVGLGFQARRKSAMSLSAPHFESTLRR